MSCFRNMLLMLYNWMALAQKVETRRNTDILDHFQIVSLSHYFKRENTKGIFIAFPGAINIGGLGADVDIPRVSGEKVSEKETFEQLIYFLASCVKKVFFYNFCLSGFPGGMVGLLEGCRQKNQQLYRECTHKIIRCEVSYICTYNYLHHAYLFPWLGGMLK